MRRLILIALFAALVAGYFPAQAVADEAPPPAPCSISVPAKVVATSPYTAVYPKFPNCEEQSQTWFIGLQPVTGYGTFRVVDGISKGPWRFRDNYPTGVFPVGPSDAVVPGEPRGNSTSMEIKFGSRISLTGKRLDHLRVPLTGVVSRYLPSVNAFRRWAHRPISISYKDCAACPWKFLAMDKTDKYGAFSLAAVSFEARYYRAKVGETGTTWGRASVPVFD